MLGLVLSEEINPPLLNISNISAVCLIITVMVLNSFHHRLHGFSQNSIENSDQSICKNRYYPVVNLIYS